jgi:hypothetical protein
VVAALVGACWGLAGYAVLWGHTPLVVHRPFVVSIAGTVLLLPVRLVLWGIRLAEEHVAGRPFDFSRNDAWIGAVAAVIGAAITLVAFLAARGAWRVSRRPARAGPAR